MRDPCPTPDALASLLFGHAADTATERHVADCAACAARLANTDGEDAFTAGLRSASPALACANDPLVGALIERLRVLPVTGDTPPPAGTLTDDFGPADTPDEIGRVGPFRLVRELGRGGTGVVYLAWHEPLKREVAVKLLAADPTSGDRLTRFRREAELVARLRHPNVVPVYEVGEWAGRPYFAMEYVAGGTLAERLTAAPLAARSAAELVETLARAMQAAHEAGVLHRDLKPANVLLASRAASAPRVSERSAIRGADAAPLAKITDFGLAKAIDADGATFDTRSGAVLGTPGYLAPEQLTGATLGPAADVYSLGAILYECLTGRPPFKAATVLETLDQARTQDPPPPGRLQPGLPRDLQTVCLKCLDREPRRRYATADALADDLRRCLDGRPVAARPAAWWERAAKWAKRRPAAAGLGAASVAFLTVLTGGVVAYQARLRQEVQRAEDGEARADAQYREARQALQNMLELVNDRGASDIPRVRELRRGQLEHALTFYLRSAARSGDDPAVRADAALAALEAGKLQRDLGRTDDAGPNLERARDAFAALAAEFPGRADYRAGLAETWTALATWYKSPADRTRCGQQALTLYEILAHDDPASADVLAGRAMCHHNLGTAAYHAKRPDEAVEHYLAAERLCDDYLRRRPDDLKQRTALAQTLLSLSLTYQGLGRKPDAIAYHDRAEAALEDIVRRAPDDHAAARGLAVLRVNWAYVQRAEKRTDAALADVAKNFALLAPLLEREPNAIDLRHALHLTHGVRANILDESPRTADAVDAWRKVVETSAADVRSFNRLFLATALARDGQHAAAFAEVEALADLPESREFGRQYRLVQVCCRAAAVADVDAAERYGAKAVTLLAKARAAMDAATWQKLLPEFRDNATLAPLRGRADYQQLVNGSP